MKTLPHRLKEICPFCGVIHGEVPNLFPQKKERPHKRSMKNIEKKLTTPL